MAAIHHQQYILSAAVTTCCWLHLISGEGCREPAP